MNIHIIASNNQVIRVSDAKGVRPPSGIALNSEYDRNPGSVSAKPDGKLHSLGKFIYIVTDLTAR
jgi:hypothetical protein